MKTRLVLFHILRIVTGLIFITSALFKLLSIDIFELYIFTQQVFNFNISAALARIIISFEFLIGGLLVAGLYFKNVYRYTIAVMILFSVFLLVRIFTGNNDENCNCFGEFIKMTPLESLIKNLAILIILFLIRTHKGIEIKSKKFYAVMIILPALIIPPVYSAPDFLFSYEREKQNFETSSQLIHEAEQLRSLSLESGKKLVCFFSVSCDYCIKASTKISVITEKYDLQENVFYIFAGDSTKLEEFWEAGGSEQYSHTFLKMRPFFKIAGPTVPVIYLMENGKIVEQYNYRNLDEAEIREFFE